MSINSDFDFMSINSDFGFWITMKLNCFKETIKTRLSINYDRQGQKKCKSIKCLHIPFHLWPQALLSLQHGNNQFTPFLLHIIRMMARG